MLLLFILLAGGVLLGLLGSGCAEQEKLTALRALFTRQGVFQKAEALVGKYRSRATAADDPACAPLARGAVMRSL